MIPKRIRVKDAKLLKYSDPVVLESPVVGADGYSVAVVNGNASPESTLPSELRLLGFGSGLRWCWYERGACFVGEKMCYRIL